MADLEFSICRLPSPPPTSSDSLSLPHPAWGEFMRKYESTVAVRECESGNQKEDLSRTVHHEVRHNRSAVTRTKNGRLEGKPNRATMRGKRRDILPARPSLGSSSRVERGRYQEREKANRSRSRSRDSIVPCPFRHSKKEDTRGRGRGVGIWNGPSARSASSGLDLRGTGRKIEGGTPRTGRQA